MHLMLKHPPAPELVWCMCDSLSQTWACLYDVKVFTTEGPFLSWANVIRTPFKISQLHICLLKLIYADIESAHVHLSGVW